MKKVYVVIPNWNGADRLRRCLDSLKTQTLDHQVIVVDNGSVDDSVAMVEKEFSEVHLILHKKNKGFSGGVNPGINYSIEQGGEYVALLNNDAVADKDWLKNLAGFLKDNPETGIATSKICDDKKTHLDSTGDLYTVWGLPFPRGRGEPYSDKYDKDTLVFGASGGASLYRIKMLKEIGLFDEDFFAYYEDVDISFRAQLAGWKIAYVPSAEVYHQISATSSQIKGFATYHTLKNLPLLLWKNVPWRLMPKVLPRLILAYLFIAGRALSRGQFGPFFKGIIMGIILWPKKLIERYKIQRTRKVPIAYIDSIITHDLPPNAAKLRAVRGKWWKLRRKRS
jgi:GT2 family glycosyltransferase